MINGSTHTYAADTLYECRDKFYTRTSTYIAVSKYKLYKVI